MFIEMVKRLTIPVACFALGGIAGIVLRIPDEATIRDPSSALTTLPTTVQDKGQQRNPTKHAHVLLKEFLNGVASTSKAYQSICAMNGSDLERLADELWSLPSSRHDGYRLRSIVMARLAELDPERAFAYIEGKDNARYRRTALGTVIGHIAISDTAAAVDLIRELTDQQDIDAALEGVSGVSLSNYEAVGQIFRDHPHTFSEWSCSQFFSGWCRKDPQAAIAFFEKIPATLRGTQALTAIARSIAADLPLATHWMNSLEPSERRRAARTLAGEIAANDPSQALGFLKNFPGQEMRAELLDTVAFNWNETAPDEAIAWMRSLPQEDLLLLLEGAQHSILETSPEGFAELVAKLPQGSRSDSYVSRIANEWGKADPKAAASWVATLPKSAAQEKALGQIARNWSDTDPQAAAAFLDDSGAINQDVKVLGAIARNWIGSDPVAALHWASNLEIEETGALGVLGQAVSAWARTDPAATSVYVQNLKDSAQRAAATEALARDWGAADAGAAESWILETLSSDDRSGAYAALIQGMAKSNAIEAARLYDSQVELGNNPSSVVGEIATNWSKSDPGAAANWAADISDQEGQSRAFYRVAQTWGQVDPLAASEWVSDLQEGPSKDNAINALSRSIEDDDPHSAFTWGSSMSPGSLRNTVLEGLITRWARKDSVAARSALLSAELPEETRVKLMERLPRETR